MRLSRARELNASLHGEAVCCTCDEPLPSWAVTGGGLRGPKSKSEKEEIAKQAEMARARWAACTCVRRFYQVTD
eukprot:3028854-Prymnesium_polylepis.1